MEEFIINSFADIENNIHIYNLIKINISKKIQGYKKQDKIKKEIFPIENNGLNTLTIEDAFDIMKTNFNVNCPVCEDKLEYYNIKPWCVYQFSLDKIDNKKVHCKDNIRIVCFNCNALRSCKSDYITSKECKRKHPCTKDCHVLRTYEHDNDNERIRLDIKRKELINEEYYKEIRNAHSEYNKKQPNYIPWIPTIKIRNESYNIIYCSNPE